MRILLATHVPPYPPVSGGRQRTSLLLRALRQHGEVDLLLLVNDYNRADAAADADSGGGASALVAEPSCSEGTAARLLRRAGLAAAARALAYHAAGGRHLLQPCPEAAAAARRQLPVDSYDLVVARYLRTAAVCGLLDGARRVALDVDDYAPGLIRARLPWSDPLTRMTLRRQLRFTEASCAELLPRCRHLWVAHAGDLRHPMLAAAGVLPNLPYTADGTFPEAVPFEPGAERRLLVIGTWTYSANAEGLERFLREAWPRVRAAVPGATLLVGGRVPEARARRWRAQPGVELAGFVDDLRAFYARGVAFVAPILFGGGTNIKVLEGAACGRAGVLTATAARGYEQTLVPSGGLRVAGSMAEFGDQCAALLIDPAGAREAGRAARAAAASHYAWERFTTAVADGVRRALA